MGLPFSLLFLFPSGKYLEVELLGHMTVLFLIFWGASIVFSIVSAPISFLLKAHKSSLSPDSHQHLLFLVFLVIATVTGVRWNLTMVLICVFPRQLVMLNSSSRYLLAISIYSLEKCVFKSQYFWTSEVRHFDAKLVPFLCLADMEINPKCFLASIRIGTRAEVFWLCSILSTTSLLGDTLSLFFRSSDFSFSLATSLVCWGGYYSAQRCHLPFPHVCQVVQSCFGNWEDI